MGSLQPSETVDKNGTPHRLEPFAASISSSRAPHENDEIRNDSSAIINTSKRATTSVIAIAGAGIIGLTLAAELKKTLSCSDQSDLLTDVTIVLIDPAPDSFAGSSAQAGGMLSRHSAHNTPVAELFELSYDLHTQRAETRAASRNTARRSVVQASNNSATSSTESTQKHHPYDFRCPIDVYEANSNEEHTVWTEPRDLLEERDPDKWEKIRLKHPDLSMDKGEGFLADSDINLRKFSALLNPQKFLQDILDELFENHPFSGESAEKSSGSEAAMSSDNKKGKLNVDIECMYSTRVVGVELLDSKDDRGDGKGDSDHDRPIILTMKKSGGDKISDYDLRKVDKFVVAAGAWSGHVLKNMFTSSKMINSPSINATTEVTNSDASTVEIGDEKKPLQQLLAEENFLEGMGLKQSTAHWITFSVNTAGNTKKSDGPYPELSDANKKTEKAVYWEGSTEESSRDFYTRPGDLVYTSGTVEYGVNVPDTGPSWPSQRSETTRLAYADYPGADKEKFDYLLPCATAEIVDCGIGFMPCFGYDALPILGHVPISPDKLGIKHCRHNPFYVSIGHGVWGINTSLGSAKALSELMVSDLFDTNISRSQEYLEPVLPILEKLSPERVR